MFIIAEAGLNHGGSLDMACNYALIAQLSGADAVKYQYTDIDATWHRNSERYNELAGDLRDEIKKCEMTRAEWKELKEYCDSIDIEIMATPSTPEILTYLIQIGMQKIKIGSDRAAEDELLAAAKESGKQTFISTGFSRPDADWAGMFYCISKYPTDLKEIDYTEMFSGKYCGFSDHTLDIEILPADIGWRLRTYGNKIIYWEKHFKLNNSCIDSDVGIGPHNLQEWIENVRRHCR